MDRLSGSDSLNTASRWNKESSRLPQGISCQTMGKHQIFDEGFKPTQAVGTMKKLLW